MEGKPKSQGSERKDDDDDFIVQHTSNVVQLAYIITYKLIWEKSKISTWSDRLAPVEVNASLPRQTFL